MWSSTAFAVNYSGKAIAPLDLRIFGVRYLEHDLTIQMQQQGLLVPVSV